MKFLQLRFLVIFAVIFTQGLGVAPANASAPQSNYNYSGESSVQNDVGPEFRSQLEAEGLFLQAAQVSKSLVEVSVADSIKNPAYTLTLSYSEADSKWVLRVVEKDSLGDFLSREYDVLIHESTQEHTSFTLIDRLSSETYLYDSSLGGVSIAFVIPIAYAGIALGTILYYLAIGAAIIVAGVVILEASKAVTQIISANNTKSINDRRDYYSAYISGSNVYISPNGLSSSQAQVLGRAGNDIWAISRDKAKQLAKLLNLSGVPIGPEAHGAGYLWHYHPFNRQPNMHAFFGSPS